MRQPRRPVALIGGKRVRQKPPRRPGPKARARHHVHHRKAGAKSRGRRHLHHHKGPQPPKPKLRHHRHKRLHHKHLRHLRKHHKAHGPRKHYKRPPVRTRKKLRGLAAPVTAGQWVTGGNDQHASCVATAVANSLLAVTGIRVTDADVLDLHERAGGGMVPVTAVLRALLKGGIGGCRARRVRPAGALLPGVVCAAGPHAVTVTEPGWCVSWGAEYRLRDVTEAWAIEWETGD